MTTSIFDRARRQHRHARDILNEMRQHQDWPPPTDEELAALEAAMADVKQMIRNHSQYTETEKELHQRIYEEERTLTQLRNQLTTLRKEEGNA